MEDEDVQMHHTAISLRQMMPQADFRQALGLMMADMEAAAKDGKCSITFLDGDYGVDDMAGWIKGRETTRAARIAIELKRLGYSVNYHLNRPHTDPTLTMIVSW